MLKEFILVLTLLEKVKGGGDYFEVLLTSEVWGAVFPVDAEGNECSLEAYSNTPCECYGGAARLLPLTQEASLAFDTGGFFSGSGLIYPTLGGGPSGSLFEQAQYASRALGWRDLQAGSDAIIDYIGEDSTTIFVATNLNMTGNPLESRIEQWTMIEISDEEDASEQDVSEEDVSEEVDASEDDLSEEEDSSESEAANDYVEHVAVLSIVDKIVLEELGSDYVERVQPLEQSLISALAELTRLPIAEQPVLTVLLLPWFLPKSDMDILLPDSDPSNEEDQEAVAILLGQRHPSIDLIVRTGGKSTESTLSLHSDWSGHKFGLAHLAHGGRGAYASKIAVQLTDDDFGVEYATMSKISLDCNLEEDESVKDSIIMYKNQAHEILESTVAGQVTLLTNEGCDGEGLCYGPRFISQAIREMTEAFVVVVDPARLVQDLQGEVTMADIYRAVPSLEEIGAIRVTFEEDSDARLIAVNIFNDILSNAVSTGFLYSDTLDISWALIDNVVAINDISIYDLTIEEMQTIIQSTEQADLLTDGILFVGALTDIQTVFPNDNVVRLGASAFEFITNYLQRDHSEVAFDPVAVYGDTLAVSRDPDITLAHVALLCGTGPRRTEDCDHARFAAAMLNDPFDGRFDDLAPQTRIITYTAYVGEDASVSGYRTCGVEGKGIEGLIDIINNRLPDGASLVGVITSCSSDVAQVGSIEGRAQVAAATGRDADYVIVSPSSTATLLKDETAYPSVARLVTSEDALGAAAARLAEDYGWDRVAIIYEDSIWGTSAAQGFADRHLSTEFGGSIIGSGCASTLTENDCARYALDPNSNEPVGLSVPTGYITSETVNGLLDFIELNQVNIVFIVLFDDEQRIFFTAANDRGFVQTPQYGWITNLPTDAALLDAAGQPATDAIYGQLGSLGFVESFPDYGEIDILTSYLDTRAFTISTAACSPEGRENAAPDDDNPTFPVTIGSFVVCDQDGDPTTTSTYGQVWFDAVLMLANAIPDVASVSEMYDAILALSVDGVSGSIILSPESGDRQNRLNLANLQVDESPVLQGTSRRKLRAVALPSPTAGFVDVAEYEASQDELNLLSDASIIFPGSTEDIPTDEIIVQNSDSGSKSSSRSSTEIIIIVVVIAASVLCLLATVFLYIVREQRLRFREEAIQFAAEYDVTKPFLRQRKRIIVEKSRADIGAPPKFPLLNRFVLEKSPDLTAVGFDGVEVESDLDLNYEDSLDYHGNPKIGIYSRLDNNDIDLKDDTKQEDDGLASDNARTVFRDMWCWKEDDDHLHLHRDADLIDGNWVQYSDVDQERLCDLWTLVQRGESTSPVLRIETNNHEEKAAYAVNVDRMTQTRIGVKDAGSREIRRIPGRRRVYLTFYWLEDPEPQKWKNADDGKVYQPDQDVPWTQYTDDNVQNTLAQLFAAFQADPRASLSLRDVRLADTDDWILRLNQWNQATTNFAEVQYEIDIRTFEQTRLDTGKVRCIAVRMDHPDSPARDRHDAADDEQYQPPPGLPPKDRLLPLSPGMQISLIKAPRTLADGYGEWGYGAELDPLNGDIIAEGWFPMVCVEKRSQAAIMPEGVANRLVTQTQPPPDWTGAESIYSKNTNVRLMPGTREWRDVAALFDTETYSIASILRIQNFDRWIVYRTYGADKKEIRPVFHGTSREAADKILATGLNRDHAKNSLYGRGVNFFLDSSKSCHRDYGNLDSDSKYVFVCSISVSSTTQGEENAIIPQGYDTFVDSISKPTLYVTTHDAQTYTHYLVKLNTASRHQLTSGH